MISIVVYGRNDNHGYNLHKRVALSLNCFAEILTDRDDEILFVDYNTPDEHPSLIETIQDTLTARAKQRLRVIRAFAAVHGNFADKTPFPVIEAIARNIGFRRTNPSNRWVLSTNTDMILTPRVSDRSFSEIAAGLEDGFYLLPRFELPEAMWELLDRNDPAGVISRVRDWGRSLSLNEVINRPLVRYDAPGDFQLVLRRDLIAMSGMDERMLLGNMHVDSNLCRRAEALRGELRTLVDHMFGYHCAHTRTATFVHSRGNVANDFERFVRNISEWRLPGQAKTWGQPPGRIEEIAISPIGLSLFESALKREVKPLSLPYDEIDFGKTIQEGLRYRIDHMLPYLASAIAPLPKNYSIGVAAARGDVTGAIAKLWRNFGFSGAIGVPRSFARRLASTGMRSDAPIIVVENEDFANAFDTYLFEFGLASEGSRKMCAQSLAARWASTDSDALTAVAATLHAFMPQERTRLRTHSPRRCFFIGAANNQFEPLVNDNFDVTFTPFTSRVRQGYIHVADRPLASAKFDPNEMAHAVQTAQARSRRPSSDEIVQTWSQLVDALHATSPPFEVTTAHISLLQAANAGQLLGLNSAEIALARTRLEAWRLSHKLAPCLDLPANGEGAGARLSKFADPADWEDPKWFSDVERFFGGNAAYSSQNRHRDVWVAGQIIHALKATGFSANSNVVVATEYPENLYAALSQLAQRVRVYRSVLVAPEGEPSTVQEIWLNTDVLPRASALEFAPTSLAAAPGGKADFVVLARNSASQHGLVGFADCLHAADAALRVGGVMILALDVKIGGREDGISESAQSLAAACADLFRSACYESAGPIDWRVSADALDRMVTNANSGRPHFVRDNNGVLIAPLVLVLRKTGATPKEVWDELREQRRKFALVPSTPYMRANAPYEIRDGAMRIEPHFPGGIAAYGPNLPLVNGTYRANLLVEPDDEVPNERSVLGVEVIAAQKMIVFQQDISAGQARKGALNIEFEVLGKEEGPYPKVDLRLRAFEGAGGTVHIGDLVPSSTGHAPTRVLRYDLLARNQIGGGAKRQGSCVVQSADAAHGHFLYGPYVELPAGWWRLVLNLELTDAPEPSHGVVNLEILYGKNFIPPLLKITPRRAQAGPVAIDFFVPPAASLDLGAQPDTFEFRLLFLGGSKVVVHQFTLESIARDSSHDGWAFVLDGVFAPTALEAALWLPPGEWLISTDQTPTARHLSIVTGDGLVAGTASIGGGSASLTLPRRTWDGSMRIVLDDVAAGLTMTPAFDVLRQGKTAVRALSPFDDMPATRVDALYITAQTAPLRSEDKRDGISLTLIGPRALLHGIMFVLRRRVAVLQIEYTEAGFNFAKMPFFKRALSAILWIALVISARIRAATVTMVAHDFDAGRGGRLANAVLHAMVTLSHRTVGEDATLAAIRARWPALTRKLRTLPERGLAYLGDKDQARESLGLSSGLQFVCVGDSSDAKDYAAVLRAFTLAGQPGTLTLLPLREAKDLIVSAGNTRNVRLAPAPTTDVEIDRWFSAADAIVLPHTGASAHATAKRSRLHKTIVIHVADSELATHLRRTNAISFSTTADLACLLEGVAEGQGSSIDASSTA